MSKSSFASHSSAPLGGMDILTEINTNLLECKVCFENFTVKQTEHRPRNLPCGHVLCLGCVRALSQPFRDRLECPFCRKACDVGETSACLALTELQELLVCGSPQPLISQNVSDHLSDHKLCDAEGLGSRGLQLSSAFGGWGQLINPTGFALFGSSGAIVVVHDGIKRVAVFSPHGRYLNGFGKSGHGTGYLCHPLDVAVAPGGHIVVTDAGDCSVKVFSSRGSPVRTIQESFQLPWGIDVDGDGQVLVTDSQAGTLTTMVMDFTHNVVLVRAAVVTGLESPKSVTVCRVTEKTAVVEHLGHSGRGQVGNVPTRLKVFSKDFTLLSQVDSFSLSLTSQLSVNISSVAFDRKGNVIVTDTQQGAIWSLGKQHKKLTLLLSEGLVLPLGIMVTFQNKVIVLDSGDHTLKTYSTS